jgi:hypothetical protein
VRRGSAYRPTSALSSSSSSPYDEEYQGRPFLSRLHFSSLSSDHGSALSATDNIPGQVFEALEKNVGKRLSSRPTKEKRATTVHDLIYS